MNNCCSESLVEATPSGLNIEELIGYATGANNMPGVIALVFKQQTSVAGFSINSQLSLLTLSFPNLTAISGASAPFSASSNPVLTSINAQSLQSFVFTSTINFNPALKALSFPALVKSGTLNWAFNAALDTVSLPQWTPANGKNVVLNDCALTQASVDHVLARCVANPAYVSGTVNLSGGSNASPSATGLADAATLTARGVNVSHN